jgi:hypothetical protein
MECGRVETYAVISKASISQLNAPTQEESAQTFTTDWHADADVVAYLQINGDQLLQEADMAIFPVTQMEVCSLRVGLYFL